MAVGVWEWQTKMIMLRENDNDFYYQLAQTLNGKEILANFFVSRTLAWSDKKKNFGLMKLIKEFAKYDYVSF